MFHTMQTCMQKFPTLYNKEIGEDDEMTQAIEQSQNVQNPSSSLSSSIEDSLDKKKD